MRNPRAKAEGDAPVAYYHCLSRIVNRKFVLGQRERREFIALMRTYEIFSGVRVVTFCVLSNHFHILLEVPHRPEILPTDAELVELVKLADCSYSSIDLERDLGRLRESGDHAAAEAIREVFFARMWDVSEYMKSLKQRFSQDYNSRKHRTGTLWESRFKSVLVEGLGAAISAIAAYIDLNPVRAGMVGRNGLALDPKDYQFSGYGQAVAGVERARVGLRIAVQARLEEEVTTLSESDVLANYRKCLFEHGLERRAGDDGSPAKKGFSQEQVEKVLEEGGKLPLHQALLCRVRYFCDGVVIGSKAFVDDFFNANRSQFGPRRKTGARRLRYLDLLGIFTLRDLRLRVITKT